MRRVFLALTFGLFLAWLLGQRLAAAPWPADVLSYLPAAPIALLLLGAVFLLEGRGQLAALLAAAIVAASLASEARWSDRQPIPERIGGENAETYRLVHWNVFRDRLPWTAKIERLRDLEADIYVLNELPRHVARGETALRFGPNFTYALGDLSVIGCRGTVERQEFVEIGKGSALWATCTLESRGRAAGPRLEIAAVDLPASPLEARKPLLEKLFASFEKRRPDLVAGDFNTPRRSTPLATPPPGYRHAYEAAGVGWPYTWPVPFPVLSIDQCLVGPRIHAVELRYVSTLESDHRLQILEFVPEPGAKTRFDH